MKLKICGLKYPDNILEVSKLEPDYMGFIFWDKSSRFLTMQFPTCRVPFKKSVFL